MTTEPVTEIHQKEKLEVTVHNGWDLSSLEMIANRKGIAEEIRNHFQFKKSDYMRMPVPRCLIFRVKNGCK